MASRGRSSRELNGGEFERRMREGDEENQKVTETAERTLPQEKLIMHNFQLLKDIPNMFHDSVIPERSVVFCVDTSGSMYHFMETVREHLLEAVMKHAAKDNAMFNLIEFNTSVTVWCDKMVPCTDSTVKAAKRWIDLLVAKTGTNTREALLAAFAFTDCEAVYLVSDGLPDSPIEQLKRNVLQASCQRPVHVTYVCEEDEDDAVSHVLRTLAKSTWGHYRVLAFGFRGPLQRASLIVNEPAACRQPPVQPLQDDIDSVCGVQIREPDEDYLRPKSRNAAFPLAAAPRPTAALPQPRPVEKTSERNGRETVGMTGHLADSYNRLTQTPLYLPVYPTVADCRCYDNEHELRRETHNSEVERSDASYVARSNAYRSQSRQSEAEAPRSIEEALRAHYELGSRESSTQFNGRRLDARPRPRKQWTVGFQSESDDEDVRRWSKERRRTRSSKAQLESDGESESERRRRAMHRAHSLSVSVSSSDSSHESDDSDVEQFARKHGRRVAFLEQVGDDIQEHHVCLRNRRAMLLDTSVKRVYRNSKDARDASASVSRPSSSFMSNREFERPVNSVEFFRPRTAASFKSAKTEKPTCEMNSRQRGYLDREAMVLQRRMKEALRLENERQGKLSAHLQRARREAVREQQATRAENQRSATREQLARQRATQQVEREKQDSALHRQKEALRASLAESRQQALQMHEKRAQLHADQVHQHKKQLFGEQQMRIARTTCAQAAQLPSEFSKTRAEQVLSLRKY